MQDEIQTHSKPVIEHAYREFLLQNHDPEVREYEADTDEIREILIHQNYFSIKDIKICIGYDLDRLKATQGFRPEDLQNIKALHQALLSEYLDPEEMP